LLTPNEANYEINDNTSALYDIQTDMKDLAAKLKERQKPDIFSYSGYFDKYHPEFHSKFEPLFGP